MNNPQNIESSKNLKTEDIIIEEHPQSFPKHIFSTNSILRHQNQQEITYYLPCYEIIQIDKDNMEATVSGTLLFSFYYGNIDRTMIEEMVSKDKQKYILLQFNQDQSIELKEEKGISKRQNKKTKIIDFVIRRSFKVRMKGNVFLTPFITIDLYLAVVVQSVSFYNYIQSNNRKEQVKINFKFNCMNSIKVTLLSHGQLMSFGYYRIAPSLFEVEYTNSREYPFAYRTSHEYGRFIENDDGEIKYFQYAHFKGSIYQYPINSILTIFIPLWTTGLIGLLVFFQQPAFSARISTIAVLVLAFVALIPTINSTIPPSPKIKLIDILVLMQLFAIVFLAIQSFYQRNKQPEAYQFGWQQSSLFWLSLLMNLLTLLAIFVLFAIHKCYWQPKYLRENDDKRIKTKKIIRQMWQNEQCDEYFSEYYIKNPWVSIKSLS